MAAASGNRANSAGVTLFTRSSVHWAARIVATSSSNGPRWSSAQARRGTPSRAGRRSVAPAARAPPGLQRPGAPFGEVRIDFLHGPGVQHVPPPEPGFPRHGHAEPHVVEPLEVVRVGVDRDEDALLAGVLQHLPARVEPVGVAVVLERDPAVRQGGEDLLLVPRVTLPRQQQPPARVTEHRDAGIGDRGDAAGRWLPRVPCRASRAPSRSRSPGPRASRRGNRGCRRRGCRSRCRGRS